MEAKAVERLRAILKRIDGRGYKAYKELQGTYRGDGFTLSVDHVQGDPFAPPSRIRVRIPLARTGIARETFATPWRKTALEDFLARSVHRAIGRLAQRRGTGKSGLIAIDAPGQEVLPRTAVVVTDEAVELRLSVGLPARGRTVLGREALEMFAEDIPALVRRGVLERDEEALRRHLELSDQQAAIRRFLREHGYVAFVADGAILPRESGVSDKPMKGPGVIPFVSPPSLAVEIPVPHRDKPLRGMAIPRGVTLIVGGGYHGKSTLLQALERGVYNHIPGDGREYVITDETAVKIRAEDGRSVVGVDLSPFIHNLPFGKDTTNFCTEDASGSTSQAANILEALEAGARVLLIDEDTSATNFMIRDARMQALVAKEKEPITPFVDTVRPLFDTCGVSAILVVGGSGDYFDVADTVIRMDEYTAHDATEEAKRIAREMRTARRPEGGERFGPLTPRVVLPTSFDAHRGKKEKVEAKGLHTILYGTTTIDLSAVEQLVDASQTRAIAYILRWMDKVGADGTKTLAELLDEVFALIADKGLDAISPFVGQHPGDLALPRRFEVAAAVNRLRTLKVKQGRPVACGEGR